MCRMLNAKCEYNILGQWYCILILHTTPAVCNKWYMEAFKIVCYVIIPGSLPAMD